MQVTVRDHVLASLPGAASARWSRAAWAGYVAILWLALLVLPVAVPLTSLDSSWYALLAHGWREALQAGTQQVFTYGPLGWLLTAAPGFDADLFATKMIGLGTAMLAVAVVLTAFVQSLPSRTSRTAAALLVLCLAPLLQDGVYVLAMLAASGLLLARERMTVAGACFVGALLAVAGLIKFSHLVLALPCVAGCVAVAWHQHSWRHAAAVAGSFLGAFVLAWVLAGQRLAGIAGYLENAAEIAAGYHDVMGTPGGGLQAGLAVACVLLLAGLCISTAFTRPRTPAHVTLAAVTLAIVLLTWKAGFVRQDDAHARIFFVMATLAPFALLAGVRKARSRWSAAAATAAVVMAIAGMQTSLGRENTVWQAPVRLAERLLQNARVLAAPQRFAAEQAEEWRRNAAATPLEETRRALGGGSIDAFGHEQGILLANSLRLRHRPVFQSYSAYTPALQEMNAACYEAPDGPDCVLFALQPIDGYFPTVADSQALLALFAGYDPQFVERDFVLMRRKPVVRRRADLPQQVIWEGTAEIGTWVEVKAVPNAVLLLSLDVGYSALGRLQGLALRPPRLFLEVRLADGTQRFRIAPAIVRAPFLLDPLVRETRELLALCHGDPLPRVQAFRVGNSAGGLRGFASRFGVRLLAVAAK